MRQDTISPDRDTADAERLSRSLDAPRIYIVDPDFSLRLSLAAELMASGYHVRAYESAEDFLSEADCRRPACLLSEVRLSGLSGPELQRLARRSEMPLGIVFMASHADVRLAVAVIRGGAVELLEKPIDASSLRTSIRAALSDARRRFRHHTEIAETLARFDSLTTREKEVMRLIADGCPTKIVARQLGLSPRTVESHRTRVMAKMAAETLSALVRQAITLERVLARGEGHQGVVRLKP